MNIDKDKILKEYIKHQQDDILQDEKFIKWFVEYTKKHKVYTDDDYVSDKMVEQMLSKIYKLTHKTYIYSINNFIDTDLLLEEDDFFVNYSVVIKIENMFINFKYIVGQGSYVAVILLEQYNGEYVDFQLLKRNEKTTKAKEIDLIKRDITAQMIDWLRDDKITTKIIKDCVEEIEMSEI